MLLWVAVGKCEEEGVGKSVGKVEGEGVDAGKSLQTSRSKYHQHWFHIDSITSNYNIEFLLPTIGLQFSSFVSMFCSCNTQKVEL